MSDREFPSGQWTGFYTYRETPGKFRTDVHFTFESGRITGEGNDSVGPFVIAGRYDATAKECFWTKTYVAAHNVFYQGFREGKGIWGTWEIRPNFRGGFQLWPRGAEDSQTEEISEEEALPAGLATVGKPR